MQEDCTRTADACLCHALCHTMLHIPPLLHHHSWVLHLFDYYISLLTGTTIFSAWGLSSASLASYFLAHTHYLFSPHLPLPASLLHILPLFSSLPHTLHYRTTTCTCHLLPAPPGVLSLPAWDLWTPPPATLPTTAHYTSCSTYRYTLHTPLPHCIFLPAPLHRLGSAHSCLPHHCTALAHCLHVHTRHL